MMKFRRFGLFLAITISILLSACGGGSGASDQSATNAGNAPTVINKVTGYVVLGPISNAKVSLYTVSPDGSKQLLAVTNSDSKGFFSFPVAPQENSIVLIEATGGSYIDEATQKLTQLQETVRAVDKWTTRTSPLSITAHSEIAVRRLVASTPNNWTEETVTLHNKAVAQALDLPDLLDYVPVDLAINQDLTKLRGQDYTMAIWAGAFSGFMHELSQSGTDGTLNNAINQMSSLLFANDYDDSNSPTFIKGMALFIRSTQLPPNVKTALLNNILGTSNSLISNIDMAIPTGKASGATSSAMVNDAFALLPEPSMTWLSSAGTVFNKRGALIAYQLSGMPNTYRGIYSASVGEVFGDGEIGVGRWHGGVITTSDRTAIGFENQKNAEILPADGGRHYGVGKTATQMPSCGLSQLALLANTKPTVDNSVFTSKIVGLTPDSKVAFQYAGGTTFIGFDLGVQLIDASVVRFQSTGGLTAPWASGYSINNKGQLELFTIYPTAPVAALPDLRLSLKGIHAGKGGKKFVAGLDIYSSIGSHKFNAAFGTTSPTDINGCATAISSNLGTNISPVPANGFYSVFAGFTQYLLSSPYYTHFSDRGGLKSAGYDANTNNLSIPSSTPIYELKGNQFASIGVTKGPVSIFGSSYDLSMPYAVAESASSLPLTGSRKYQLIGATSVVSLTNVVGKYVDVGYGSISSATLDVTFGQFPPGTLNPNYGSARVDIRGSVGGTNFTFKNKSDSEGNIINVQQLNNGGGLDLAAAFDGGYGTLAGPNGEYAVIRILSPFGSGQITSALLFKAQ